MIEAIGHPVEHHRLGLKLKPVVIGEMFLASKLRNSAYIFNDGLFTEIFAAGDVPARNVIQELISKQVREVFLYHDDLEDIRNKLEQTLIKVTRSLSVGDPAVNSNRQVKLLSLNLTNLYRNPHNDQLLIKQFQSTQNLGKFLLENKKMPSQLFHNLQKENFHFTIGQPMMSSLLLLSFLQSIHLFHDREVETLFLTSYLKDVGLGMIPEDKYDAKELPLEDQKLFAGHAKYSYDILDGRTPLTKNQLHIIQHHHFLNEKLKRILSPNSRVPETDMVFGIESTLVAVADILVAMTNDRPYRKGLTLYQALELIRKLIADDYPQEFKALVSFLRQFYRN